MTLMFAFGVVWAIWVLSWTITAAACTEMRTTVANRVLLLAGAGLLFGGAIAWPEAPALWRRDAISIAILSAALLAGFGIGWCARVYLAALVESDVLRQDDTHVIDTGPCALVRHPIYIGLIVSTAATAAASATVLSLSGGALMIVAIWRQAVLQEPYLSEKLGFAYDDYRRHVPLLMPFLPTRR